MAHVARPGRPPSRGVHFVELVGISSPDDVVSEVGSALGVRHSVTGRRTLTAAQQSDVRPASPRSSTPSRRCSCSTTASTWSTRSPSLVAFLLVTTRDLRVVTTARARSRSPPSGSSRSASSPRRTGRSCSGDGPAPPGPARSSPDDARRRRSSPGSTGCRSASSWRRRGSARCRGRGRAALDDRFALLRGRDRSGPPAPDPDRGDRLVVGPARRRGAAGAGLALGVPGRVLPRRARGPPRPGRAPTWWRRWPTSRCSSVGSEPALPLPDARDRPGVRRPAAGGGRGGEAAQTPDGAGPSAMANRLGPPSCSAPPGRGGRPARHRGEQPRRGAPPGSRAGDCATRCRCSPASVAVVGHWQPPAVFAIGRPAERVLSGLGAAARARRRRRWRRCAPAGHLGFLRPDRRELPRAMPGATRGRRAVEPGARRDVRRGERSADRGPPC